MAKGTKDPDLGRGIPPKHARIMENVKELFWCDARDEQATCRTPMTASSETSS